MSDQAERLAQDIFNRIEREGLCQLHIIEDEVRCRLRLAQQSPQPVSLSVVGEACKLVQLLLSNIQLVRETPQPVVIQIENLLRALQKGGYMP